MLKKKQEKIMEETKASPALESGIADDMVGIKGWLILVAIGVVIAPFRLIAFMLNTYPELFTTDAWQSLTSQFGDYYHPYWEPLLLSEMLFNTLITLASLYLIVLFFKKKAQFPKWYIGIAVSSLIFIVADAFAIRMIIPDAPVFDGETRLEIIRGVLTVAIWVPYMLISERVKATFVR